MVTAIWGAAVVAIITVGAEAAATTMVGGIIAIGGDLISSHFAEAALKTSPSRPQARDRLRSRRSASDCTRWRPRGRCILITLMAPRFLPVLTGVRPKPSLASRRRCGVGFRSTIEGGLAMGLGQLEVEFLLHEHRHRPITGRVLTIGKPSIALSPAKMSSLLDSYGIAQRHSAFEIDTSNQHGSGGITDRSMFAAFSDASVQAADISAYEGAEHIFNICDDVPEQLLGSFDFVVDAGSLDNVFEPGRMLMNMAKMLKPDGRLFTFAWSNSFPSAYVKISPDWIMDYFAANKFADCKVYNVEHPSVRHGETALSVWHYDPFVRINSRIPVRHWRLHSYEASAIEDERPAQVFCVAERALYSTCERRAVQKHYRGNEVQPYLDSISRFRRSSRPVFKSPTSGPIDGSESISSVNTMRQVARW